MGGGRNGSRRLSRDRRRGGRPAAGRARRVRTGEEEATGWQVQAPTGIVSPLVLSSSEIRYRESHQPERSSYKASRTCLRGGFGHDVDDTQAELPLGSVHQVQLQPAGNARRQCADDERVVAWVHKQFVGDRLERV